mgnify:CR=1 FL=1
MAAASLPPTPLRTRFAPSPTGDLHLGSVWVALASWVLARATGGAFVVRVEDLDRPRVVPGSAESILDDLTWLGLRWDEGPRPGEAPGAHHQSQRHELYTRALARLAAAGLTYPCDCSRAEIARVASAPHAGEELVYPGTCRGKDPHRAPRRPFATRLRVSPGEVTFTDGAAGPFTQNVAEVVGDFVLRRGDGTFAYQLAVVVDDLAMAIDVVVRGADLLPSTPRQLLLARALGGAAPPRYVHLPLVVGGDGERLAHRTQGAAVRALRSAGVEPEAIVGALAFGLGLAPDPAPRHAEELVAPLTARLAAGEPLRWPEEPFAVPAAFAARLPP